MPYTILLVDDDSEFREEFSESFDDYNVILAKDGEEALRLLKKANDIDIAILDVNMPGDKGTEVLKDVKDIAPETGIIMLTGYASKDVAVESLKGRADDFYEKPMKVAGMKAAIERLLDAKGKRGPIDISDIDGKIEKARHFARRNWHKKIALSDIASIVGLSPKYLSRLFKERTGGDFNTYKLRIKVDKAGEMLGSTGFTVEQIAYKLGYGNLESFIRIFEKFTGMTPTEYRKKKRRQDEKKKSRKKNARRKKSGKKAKRAGGKKAGKKRAGRRARA